MLLPLKKTGKSPIIYRDGEKGAFMKYATLTKDELTDAVVRYISEVQKIVIPDGDFEIVVKYFRDGHVLIQWDE